MTSIDLLNQLRGHHEDALQRVMSRREGSRWSGGSGWQGNVIIVAGVLHVEEMKGRVPNRHWSSEEVAAQLVHTCDEGQAFVCVLERLTDKE